MKKRFLAFIVLIAALCMAFPAFADIISNETTGTPCGANLAWEYDTETKTLTIGGTGNMSDFNQFSTGMIAPWRKEEIDDNLEKVVISNGVTSIGDNAFYWCDKITSVTIPSSVRTVNEGAFLNCSSLTNITIPNGVENIGKDAFSHCTELTGITIPCSVTSIGYGAFSSCDKLTEVTINEGVKSIDEYAFYWCGQLADITLPNSITSIGVNAFHNTPYYNDDSEWDVLYIGNHLISAKSNISGEYVVNPETKTIADSAFYYCDNLTSITIPDSVVSIGNHAFDSCNGLTSITIPKNVTSIGNEAFYCCFDLESINVDSANPTYCSENGVLYNKGKTEIIRFPKEQDGFSFTIPKGVTSIADGAFEKCQHLISITIPNSVTNIGNHAFLDCSILRSITIPDGVPTIGEKTFFDCSNLRSITIPNSVLIIGENAFGNCRKSMKINYIGSEDDWNEVIGAGKDGLTNANINFCSGISAKCYDDGKIDVKPINIENGKTVILALYGGEKGDEFIKVQSDIYNGTEITFTPTASYTRAKVMVWETFESMSPVCDSKIIE